MIDEMKTILCDIGGVLLNVDFQKSMNRVCRKTGLSPEEINARIFSSGAKDDHDSGRLAPYDFYRQVFPDEDIPFEYFREVWSDIFTENREMIDFLRSAKGKYRLLGDRLRCGIYDLLRSQGLQNRIFIIPCDLSIPVLIIFRLDDR